MDVWLRFNGFVKEERTVFAVWICHGLHCYALVFGDICCFFLQAVGIVSVGLDLSELSSQETALVSTHMGLIKPLLDCGLEKRPII